MGVYTGVPTPLDAQAWKALIVAYQSREDTRTMNLILRPCNTEALLFGAALLAALANPAPVRAAVDASVCIACHQKTNPNIVADWSVSRHCEVKVGCPDCHGDGHQSTNDIAKVQLPTPETCGECHDTQLKQFSAGKHALAWAAMKAIPTFHWQPMAMTEGMKGCGGCHKIGLKTPQEMKDLRRTSAGFGVASCDSCHTRHTFSKKKPSNPRPAKPVTWASTIRNGRCIPAPSTASATS
jgi:hypothetical protein